MDELITAPIDSQQTVGHDGVDKLASHHARAPVPHSSGPSDAAAPDAGSVDVGSSHSNNGHHNGGHTSHHEVGHGKHKRDGLANAEKSSFSEAWDASKGKWLNGAAMFAGFATVLGLSVGGVGLIIGAGQLANVLGAAVAGAAWMGGNEFVKTYRAARENKNSRLNNAIDNVREKFGHAKERVQETEQSIIKEIGELGIVGGSLSSHLGTTAFLVEVPELTLAQTAPTSQTVQTILAQGPNSRTSAVLEQSNSSALERLENSQETSTQASI